ncbi:MAG: VWA domain-containing protein [Pirellulaceae bacterium]|jgi:Ca-activated chloride channel family protein|nr:VWA domain-containing protein [Pirellulaceae bacterium]
MHEKDNRQTETDRDRDIRMSADVLGQLDDHQRHLLEVDLQANVEMRNQQQDLFRVAEALSHQHAAELLPAPSLELRNAIDTKLEGGACLPEKPAKPTSETSRWSRRRVVIAFAVTACLLVLLAIPFGQMWQTRQATDASALVQEEGVFWQIGRGWQLEGDNVSIEAVSEFRDRRRSETVVNDEQFGENVPSVTGDADDDAKIDALAGYGVVPGPPVAVVPGGPQGSEMLLQSAGGYPAPGQGGQGGYGGTSGVGGGPGMMGGYGSGMSGKSLGDRANLSSMGSSQPPGTTLSKDPKTDFGFTAGTSAKHGVAPVDSYSVQSTGRVMRGSSTAPRTEGRFEAGRTGYGAVPPSADDMKGGYPGRSERESSSTFGRDPSRGRFRERHWYYASPPVNHEQYETIVENPFVPVSQQALSTLSIDVDTASYANVRRFLTQNQLPPANAVRIEELINYFSYDYSVPEDEQPFASHLEVTECPWQPNHRLVRVGLQGKTVARKERPGCNLVFLLDVSGSMKDSNKLPLLKQAMKLLVDQLDENDRVAIVTYASQAGVRLKSTVTDKHNVIRDAINGLNANGSTNGGAGIQLAYDQALAGEIEGGINRVILATDGDLNVGITDDDALVRLIKEKAASDVFLTVLGFGEGNLKDAKLEKLADNGNGLYAYIDTLREARKVLVEQVEGSLVTIAKDVKIKVEFNPAEVQAYRLIGYENRLMTAAEFDDDKKDAGEIGAGHSVTAIYEIVPAAPAQVATAESLKYQQPAAPTVPEEQLTDAAKSGELLTLSLRYKLPDSDESTLVEVPLLSSRKPFSEASMDFRFATAVASFGMLLRDSAHRGDTSFAAVEEIASAAIGDDEKGYRTEFLDLVRLAATMK